jgi:diguanylate cyclase (GGDEF)-like protein/PAS domain S-box-containing protein
MTNKTLPKLLNPQTESFFVVNSNGEIIYQNEKFNKFFATKKPIKNIKDIISCVDLSEQKSVDSFFQGLDVFISFKVNIDNIFEKVLLNRIPIETDNKFYYLKKTPDTKNNLLKGIVLDKITENAYDIVTFLDKNGKRLYVSPSVSKIFNIDKKELMKRNIFLDIHPGDINLAKQVFTDVCKKEGQIYTNIRLRLRHPSEGWVLMEGSIVNLLHLEGINAIVVNSRSIHEVKKLQDALKEHQYKLEGIIDNSPVGIYMKDRQGHYIIVNDAWQNCLNLPKEDILGKTDFEILPVKQAAKITQYDDQVISKSIVKKCEESITYADDSTRHFITNKFALYNANKEVIGIGGISNEITELKKTQIALEKSESWFRAIVQNTLDFLTVINEQGEKLYVTPSVKKVLGYTSVEYEKQSFFKSIHPTDELLVITKIKNLIDKKLKNFIKIEARLKNKIGKWVWVELILTNQLNNQHINGILVHVSDISIVKESESKIEVLDQKLKLILQNTPDIIYFTDLNGKIIEVNEAALNFIKKPKSKVIGQKVTKVFKVDKSIIESSNTILTIQKDKPVQYEERLTTDNNKGVFLSTKFLIQLENQQEAICIISKNITDRKKYEQQLEKWAFQDQLTKLMNETSITNYISKLINDDKEFHIFAIDIDRFKNVNDGLGHDVGNKILTTFSQRLEEYLKKYGVLGRFSGDMFIAILDNTEAIGSKENLITIAKGLSESIKKPIIIEETEIHLTSTVGIVYNNTSHKLARNYIQDADTALFDAKKKNVGSISVFNKNMHSKILRQLRMESEIIRAFERGEFELYTQKVIPIENKNYNLLGYSEALIRWNHPSKGVLRPDQFLDVIYEMGYITNLDKWVIEQACKMINQQAGLGKDISLSVNISAILFGYSDLKEYIQNITKKYNINPKNLKFEITENDIIDNLENTMDIIKDIQKLGFQFILDDFGTGYSSLNYLKNMPVSAVKIDQCFINNLHEDSINKDIVKAIIQLSHSLNMEVISEGVELEETFAILKSLGTDFVQGYLLAKPEKLI